MRLLFFSILILFVPLFPWYVLAPLALVYALFHDGYELLLLALAIDAYYGSDSSVPYYTLVTAGVLFLLAILKPRLLFYTEEQNA